MNTAVINFKTDPALKRRTQKKARALGLSLSGVLNLYLRHFTTGKDFYIGPAEKPSEWLIQELKASRADEKAGRVSPGFNNAEDAIAWLKDKNRKYKNQIN